MISEDQDEGTHQNHSEHTSLAVSAYKVGMEMVVWNQSYHQGCALEQT